MLALFVKVPTMQLLRKIRSPYADPKYSADHVEWPLKVIQGQWGQWKGDKGLNNYIITLASFPKVPKT